MHTLHVAEWIPFAAGDRRFILVGRGACDGGTRQRCWRVTSMRSFDSPDADSDTVAGTPADQNEPAVTSREWDPFRDMERMHQEIDRAIRKGTEEFEFGPSAPLF